MQVGTGGERGGVLREYNSAISSPPLLVPPCYARDSSTTLGWGFLTCCAGVWECMFGYELTLFEGF